MKRPIMALLGRALSALPSFLRRSSAAIAVCGVLLVGVGMITGIIPNIIAALKAQSLAYRISAENEVAGQTRNQATVNLDNSNANTLAEIARTGINPYANKNKYIEPSISINSILFSASKIQDDPKYIKNLKKILDSKCENSMCEWQDIYETMKDYSVLDEFIILYPNDQAKRNEALNTAFQLHKYGAAF